MKKAIYLTFIISALCFYNLSLFGQKQLLKANKSFQKKDYYTAMSLYKDALTEIKDSTKLKTIYFRIAECYRYGNYPTEAQTWYDKALGLGYQDSSIYFTLGNVALNNGNYELAKAYFNKQLSIDSNSIDAKLKIESIEYALNQGNETPKYEVRNERVFNSKFSEYSPYYIDNRLIFASSRYDEGDIKNQYKYTGQGFSDFYESEYSIAQGRWLDPNIAKGGINSKFNDGTFCYDKKTNTAYFMQCNGPDGKVVNCNIYYTSYDTIQKKWGKAILFEFNSTIYSIGHPTLTSDGKTMIYTSDILGGLGNTDLWMISKGQDSKWSNPKNLGKEINTSGEDMFPFLFNDTLLYFASNGHPGFGGLDLFVSTYTNGTFSKPVNLGVPFNTFSDDFGIILASQDSGMFCSNRAGGEGSDDIYAFNKIPVTLNAMGVVVEKLTDKVINNAIVLIKGSDFSVDSTLSDSDGKYQFTSLKPNTYYTVTAIKSGYLVDLKSFSTETESEKKVYSKATGYNIDFELILIATPQVEKKDSALQEIIIPDIYYDFDKWSLRDTSKFSLDKIIAMLNLNPKLKIRINSHTDNRGEDKYNFILSENRAQSVVNYLIEHRIGPNRLTFKGWGKSKLLIANAKTEEEHQMNRRTTFSITNSEFLNSTDQQVAHKKIEEQIKLKIINEGKSKLVVNPNLESLTFTQPLTDSTVAFRIQFSAVTSPLIKAEYKAIESEIPEFKVEYTKQKDGFYKYTIGTFTNLDEAKKTLIRVKKIKPDSFIIAYKGNTRITIETALKLLQK